MKILFRSKELWELIDDGFTDVEKSNVEEEKRLEEITKKEAKDLFFIKQVFHDTIFSRIDYYLFNLPTMNPLLDNR
ncbi:MAG: hypothetical protein Q8776_02570 [Sweet potato little leaf phytoplasma]|nr:hypothetical protein [Sweet potato little leaf phytoplasma]